MIEIYKTLQKFSSGRKNSPHLRLNPRHAAAIRPIFAGVRATPQKFAPYLLEFAPRRQNSPHISRNTRPPLNMRPISVEIRTTRRASAPYQLEFASRSTHLLDLHHY